MVVAEQREVAARHREDDRQDHECAAEQRSSSQASQGVAPTASANSQAEMSTTPTSGQVPTPASSSIVAGPSPASATKAAARTVQLSQPECAVADREHPDDRQSGTQQGGDAERALFHDLKRGHSSQDSVGPGLEVPRLGDAGELGVVAAGARAREDVRGAAGVGERVGADLVPVRAADAPRAGAGAEQAARPREARAAQDELLVGARGGGERAPRRRAWRARADRGRPRRSARPAPRARAADRRRWRARPPGCARPLRRALAAARATAASLSSMASTCRRGRLARERQREAAVVGERVERPRARRRQRRERRVVVGLIEEAAGLPVGQQIGLEAVAAQAIDDARLAGRARRPAKRGSPSKSRAEPSSRATTTRAPRRARTSSAISVARGVHRHRRRLDDRGVGVAVDDQARQAVALGVHDAIGVAVEAHREAQRERGVASRASTISASGRASPSRASMRSASRARAAQVATPSRLPRPSSRRPAPGRRRRRRPPGPRTTSCRKTQGWPARMRAAPRALTTAIAESKPSHFGAIGASAAGAS